MFRSIVSVSQPVLNGDLSLFLPDLEWGVRPRVSTTGPTGHTSFVRNSGHIPRDAAWHRLIEHIWNDEVFAEVVLRN